MDPWTQITGNLSRLIEPVLLYLLATEQAHHGYELRDAIQDFALTPAEIDVAAIYRTLKVLQQNEYVASTWAPGSGGPARRLYRITPQGREHLQRWAQVLEVRGRALIYFAGLCSEISDDLTTD